MVAAREAHQEIVQMLVDSGASTTATDTHQQTAWHYAKSAGRGISHVHFDALLLVLLDPSLSQDGAVKEDEEVDLSAAHRVQGNRKLQRRRSVRITGDDGPTASVVELLPREAELLPSSPSKAELRPLPPWCYQDVARPQAEAWLADSPPGTFLVRQQAARLRSSFKGSAPASASGHMLKARARALPRHYSCLPVPPSHPSARENGSGKDSPPRVGDSVPGIPALACCGGQAHSQAHGTQGAHV